MFGMILFLGLLFFMYKHYAKREAFSGGRGWCEGKALSHEFRHRASPNDDAMKLARDRLANSEISPEDFEIVKQGLRDSQVAEADHFRKDDSAYNIARIRFAKGEISIDEFDALRKALI